MNKPATASEKRFKKYLRRKWFKYSKRLNFYNSKKMIEYYNQDDKRNSLLNLNYRIRCANNCASKYKKSRIMQYVEVPEDKEIIVDTKNKLLKAKLGENYIPLKHIKKIRNNFIICPQSIDEALYSVNSVLEYLNYRYL